MAKKKAIKKRSAVKKHSVKASLNVKELTKAGSSLNLEKKPTFVRSLYELASVYMKKGEAQNAIEPLRKMLEVEPRNTFGIYALGLAYAQTGERTGALEQYYLLQSLNPQLAATLMRSIPK